MQVQHLRDSRSGPRWLAVLVLVFGAWVLQAQDPGATQADLEKRVAELEARLLKAGSATRIKAPFEVIDASGGVVLRVAQAKSAAAAVNIYHAGPNQTAISVNANGKELAGLGALGQHAMVFVADDNSPRVVVSGKGEVVDGVGGWQVTLLEEMQLPFRARNGHVWGSNTGGEAVGEYMAGGIFSAVKWLSSGDFETLPVPHAGLSRARDINDEGWIVGLVWDNAQTCERAALWRLQ